MTRSKTYKRETAGVMLAFLGGMFVWGVAGNADAMATAESLKMPLLLWAGGAFGMDAWSKQL